MCHRLASEYGKWPHEVMLARNDGPGPFDVSLLIFDIQCLEFHEKEVLAAQKKAASRAKRR